MFDCRGGSALKNSNIMKIILELAAAVGCKLYDGQENKFLTINGMGQANSAFSKSVRKVIKMFGQVKS